jgi:hypothetical protein
MGGVGGEGGEMAMERDDVLWASACTVLINPRFWAKRPLMII